MVMEFFSGLMLTVIVYSLPFQFVLNQ